MLNGKKIALGASAAAVALGVSLGATGMAWATTTTPAPSSSSSAIAESPSDNGTRDDGTKEGRGGHGPRGGVNAAELATKLGVEETSVSDALQASRDAAMANSGTGTGEKPDREAMEASLAASLADSLGLDEATVQTAIDELKSERQAERTAAVQERLDAAVTDGSLTQAEADGAAKAFELGILGGGGRG